MIKKILFCLVFANMMLCISAKEDKMQLSASLIPDSLKQNADIVFRYSHTSIDVTDMTNMVIESNDAVTILNQNGDYYASQKFYYSRNSKIESIEIVVLDALGNEIRKVKPSEIVDQSVYSYSLYSDYREKIVSLTINNYPYTIVTKIRERSKSLYAYPSWYVLPGREVSVQKTSYRISYPKNLAPRFKAVNCAIEAKTEVLDDKIVKIWQAENLVALKNEPKAVKFSEYAPVLLVAPSDFSFENYHGNMDSWESLGNWISELYSGRQQLSVATIDKLNELVKNKTSTYEKVDAIYNYLQQNTRYVGIQIGIGGYQTFPASSVEANGYGDCKALSNYMVSMLKAVNINAYSTLIGNGNVQIKYLDFPNMYQANHMIVCVPNDNDTIWLECTSQNLPTNYIGLGNSDRNAVLITPQGGKVVRTPIYTKQMNFSATKMDVALDSVGNQRCKIETDYHGVEADKYWYIISNSKEEQKKKLLSNLSFSSPSILSINYQSSGGNNPSIRESLVLKLEKQASISGNRIFVPLNIPKKSESIPQKIDNRKTNFENSYAYCKIDSINFSIPEGYSIESMPTNATIDSPYGTLSTQFTVSSKMISFVRKLEISQGVWQPSSYESYRKFYADIFKLDNASLILVKR